MFPSFVSLSLPHPRSIHSPTHLHYVPTSPDPHPQASPRSIHSPSRSARDGRGSCATQRGRRTRRPRRRLIRCSAGGFGARCGGDGHGGFFPIDPAFGRLRLRVRRMGQLMVHDDNASHARTASLPAISVLRFLLRVWNQNSRCGIWLLICRFRRTQLVEFEAAAPAGKGTMGSRPCAG